jgi:hypothetical protein
MNATEREQEFHIAVEGIAGAKIDSKDEVEVGPAEARWIPVRVQVAPATASTLGPGAHPIRFSVVRRGGTHGDRRHDGEVTVIEKSTFVIPR